MTSTQVTPAVDPSFSPTEGLVLTGALDTATGEEIGVPLDLNRSGQTLVVVTHNPDLAARYAARVIEIVDGRVASDAATGARR